MKCSSVQDDQFNAIIEQFGLEMKKLLDSERRDLDLVKKIIKYMAKLPSRLSGLKSNNFVKNEEIITN